MLIIVDDKIPNLEERLGTEFEIRRLPGQAIRRADLEDADALLVRSVTHVGPELLDGTRIGFVGSATAGTDHVAVSELEAAGITFAHAAGANAPAVCDWVLAAVFEMADHSNFDPFDATVGIVGVGNVGRRLAERLEALGIDVLLNDPPRLEAEPGLTDDQKFVDLDDLVAGSTVVSLHVPLVEGGRFPTRDLLNSARLRSMSDGACLVNTSRGAVVNEPALLTALNQGRLAALLDVWENEPAVNCGLVEACAISTAHIAGYGRQSKDRATQAVVSALLSWANGSGSGDKSSGRRSHLPIAPPGPDTPDLEFAAAIVRQAYDIQKDHLRLQGLCSFPPHLRSEMFTELRRSYRFRDEFSTHAVQSAGLSSRHQEIAAALGFETLPS